jgi:hypothetical protein
MKTDGNVEVKSHAFLTSLLDVVITTEQNHDSRNYCVTAVKVYSNTLCGSGQGQWRALVNTVMNFMCSMPCINTNSIQIYNTNTCTYKKYV